jgi:hypothetical protein
MLSGKLRKPVQTMSDDDLSKRLLREIQPEIDRMRADHERTMRLIAAMPEPTDEQRRAIAEANSPEGWRRSIDDVVAQTAAQPSKGGAMRTFGIWVFGLLASTIIGALIGSRFDDGYSSNMGFWSFIAGILTFACLRLWFGQPRKISN